MPTDGRQDREDVGDLGNWGDLGKEASFSTSCSKPGKQEQTEVTERKLGLFVCLGVHSWFSPARYFGIRFSTGRPGRSGRVRRLLTPCHRRNPRFKFATFGTTFGRHASGRVRGGLARRRLGAGGRPWRHRTSTPFEAASGARYASSRVPDFHLPAGTIPSRPIYDRPSSGRVRGERLHRESGCLRRGGLLDWETPCPCLAAVSAPCP